MAEHHPDCAKIRRVKPLYCTCGADRRIDQPPASTPAAVPDAVPDGRSVNWRQNATQRGVDAYKQWKGAPYGMSVEHLIHNVIEATLDEAGFFALRDERDQWRNTAQLEANEAKSWQHRAEAAEAQVAELQVALREARERLTFLAEQATQNTAYDIYGDGGRWLTGFSSEDNRLDFYEAIDAALAAGREG
jgi:hypothetical protein